MTQNTPQPKDEHTHTTDKILNVMDQLPLNRYAVALRLTRWYKKEMQAHDRQLLNNANKFLDNLENKIDYNAHDMGALGLFIRTQYVHNFIAEQRTALAELRKELGL